MKWILILLGFLVTPAAFCVQENPCVVIGSAVELSMRRAMRNDLGINENDINKSKIELLLLENTAISQKFSAQLAAESKRTLSHVTYQELLDAFQSDNPRNLIVKYTYHDQMKRKNIFIGSSTVNKNECSVSFNGYITVSREF